jgi:FMN phosphatase YigB (HAD superfamily)
MSNEVGLVCFDLGRVLVRICDDWRQACRIAGVTPRSDAFEPGKRARFHDAVCRVEVGEIRHEGFCREVSELFGLQPAEVAAVSDAFPRGMYPGTVELLDELNAYGIPTACLSNTNENHWRLMADPASHTFFPFDRLTHAFASHLIRRRKPDDAIYAHVERESGVPAASIVFFDDVEENIAGASRRGWRACHIDPKPDDPLPQIRSFLRRQGLSL